MRLGDADRQAAEAARLVSVELPRRDRVVLDSTGAVDPQGDCLDLLAKRRGVRVEELEDARLVRGLDHCFGQLRRPAPAIGEVVDHRASHAQVLGELADRSVLGRVITRK